MIVIRMIVGPVYQSYVLYAYVFYLLKKIRSYFNVFYFSVGLRVSSNRGQESILNTTEHEEAGCTQTE